MTTTTRGGGGGGDDDDSGDIDGEACAAVSFVPEDVRARLLGVARALTRDGRRDDEDDDVDDDVDDDDDDDEIGEMMRMFIGTIEMYREQATLLDPLLEALITPLAVDVLEREARRGGERGAGGRRCLYSSRRLGRACVILDALSSVRGWKTCIRFYPNAARDLEPAVKLLAWTSTEASAVGLETRRVVLSWISMLALTPFDLVSIDSATSMTVASEHDAVPLVVRELVTECKRCLGDSGATRDAAAATLAKLLTRPDMSEALISFFDWAGRALKGLVSNDRQELSFLIPGVLRALAGIYKSGARDVLLAHAERTWRDVSETFQSEYAKSSTLVRQLSVKLATRVGLVFMKPRVVSWRYNRGSRCLQDNLTSAEKKPNSDGAAGNSQTSTSIASGVASQGDSDFVDEAVDDIVEMFLVGLRDTDTVVRWSAAKGLGRIASRLPRDFGDEVVGAVLECLSITESDSTWHGACLALAELARRGLLLPSRLAETIPLVVEALTYDVRRGPHSVGSHVRDAACYVCWAFARAYAPDVLTPYVNEIAPTLLMVACFDREVNCRRAASAAFQESVGRLGQFPHGIDIVTIADYFSLGAKVHASLTVAPYICRFDEYRVPMLEHILDAKLTHWEHSSRSLATQTVGVLGDLDPHWILDIGLPTVLDRACHSDLPTRHGAILAIGEMILVAHRANLTPCLEARKKVADVIPNIQRHKLFRGKGSELMRGATCRLIECIAKSARSMPVDHSTREILLSSAEESLRCSNVDIQIAAANAITAYAHAYYNEDDDVADIGVSRVLAVHSKIITKDPLGVIRRGSALLLGALPERMLFAPVEGGTPAWSIALNALISATVPELDAEMRDAETRVNATMSLTELAITLLNLQSTRDGEKAVLISIATRVIDALLDCMLDYSVDNRGDVGSWVREAAMGSLPLVVAAMQKFISGTPLDDVRTTRMFSSILKQCAEKIDRTRIQAMRSLVLFVRGGEVNKLGALQVANVGVMSLAALDNCIAFQTLCSIVPESLERVPDASRPKVIFDAIAAPLLKESAYAFDILNGWFVSAGGIADGLAHFSSNALVSAMSDSPNVANVVIHSLVRVMTENKHNDRLTLPTLRVCDFLISRGCLPQSHEIALALVESIRSECFSSRDISKLTVGASCLAHFIRAQAEEVHKSSATGLLALMVNRYPRVRREAAEQMYMGLIALDEPSGDDERASELLSSNSWDVPASATKNIRIELYKLLRLDLPAFVLKDIKASASIQHHVNVLDEHGTYASLVENAGY